MSSSIITLLLGLAPDLIRLIRDIMDPAQNDAEVEARWLEAVTRYKAASDRWEASKGDPNA